MNEWKMIFIAAILTGLAIYFSPDGFYGRWCTTHPEFCDPAETGTGVRM